MGDIRKIEEFCCKSCGYITRDPDKIDYIRKNHGECPACFNGKHGGWYSKNDKPIHKC